MANSRKSIAINYGVLFGVFSVVLVLIQYSIGDFSVSSGAGSGNWIFTLISILASFVFPILAINKIKSIQSGYVTLGEGFKAGFTMFIVNALLVCIWMLSYTYVLEPNYQEELLNNSYNQMQVQNPNMSEEQMETALEWTEKFTTPIWMVIFTILTNALFGAIVSVIVAAILQKKRPESL